jgi:hypothetical protein
VNIFSRIVCWLFLLQINWNNFKKVTLEDIGKLLEKIESVIKSIPGLGAVWSWLEDKVSALIKSLLNKVGIALPDFGIDFSFFDKLQKKVQQTVDDMFSGIDQLIDVSTACSRQPSFLHLASQLTSF